MLHIFMLNHTCITVCVDQIRKYANTDIMK